MNIKPVIHPGLLLALACVPDAYAQTKCDVFVQNVNHYDICATIDPATISASVAGTFQSTTPHLGPLSGWIDINHSSAWRCDTHRNEAASYIWVGLHTWMKNGSLLNSFTFEGKTYTLYKAGSNENRVGYIMRQTPCILQNNGGSCHTQREMNINNTNTSATDTDSMHRFCLNNAHKNTYGVRIATQIRLFKWDDGNGGFPTSNFSLPLFQVAEFRWWSQVKGSQFGTEPAPENMLARPRRYSTAKASFTRLDNTCTTPSQTVLLPPTPKSDFTGTWSTAGATNFTLELTQCSADIQNIQYKLKANGSSPYWDPDNLNGRIQLGAGSTATGVGVQVLDGNGTPIAFHHENWKTLSGYQTGNLTASIPLQARYIQTGNITPGTVLANMTVEYQYQ